MTRAPDDCVAIRYGKRGVGYMQNGYLIVPVSVLCKLRLDAWMLANDFVDELVPHNKGLVSVRRAVEMCESFVIDNGYPEHVTMNNSLLAAVCAAVDRCARQ